jgi:two-component system, chemotaxis family, protein-glutamate methylesterase/glutaminase
MAALRVLVVEDSLTVRKRLCAVLSADPDFELIGEAEDGKRAIDLCRELRPEVVTMDMMLPVMSGLAATEYIMAHCPTPILIVSSSTNRGELFKTYEALAAGALDILEKPNGDEPDGVWEKKLVSTLKLIARIRVITHPRARLGAMGRTPPVQATNPIGPRPRQGRFEVAAIGASTGGPAAILSVLRSLPDDFQLPVLLVLHIGEPFGVAFAEWLDGQTKRSVAYAQDGQPVASVSGGIVMAPPDRHLIVRDGRLWLTSDPERHSCRPSVDVLFESLAREYASSVAACLLTGMGRDGAAGLLAIRASGGLTFAQDEATSVVYGMPREAVLLGAAEQVLPLDEIGPALGALGALLPRPNHE